MLGDFMRDQIQPMQGEIQLNIGKLKKLFKISKFQFSVFSEFFHCLVQLHLVCAKSNMEQNYLSCMAWSKIPKIFGQKQALNQ